MSLSWLEGFFYGLFSGLTEILPISSQAHQQLMLHILGVDYSDPIMDFLVHIALAVAIAVACLPQIEQIRRERKIGTHSRHGQRRVSRILLDLKLIKNTVVTFVIGYIILSLVLKTGQNLLILSFFFLINGIVLYLPERMIQANKDVRSMSSFDSILIGLSGSCSAFSGISRIGAMFSTAIARGAEKSHAINWVLLISIPALLLISLIDFVNIFGSQYFVGSVLVYFLAALGSFVGGYSAVRLLRLIISRTSFAGFAYYSWGAALLTFIIYLTVV